MKGHSHRPEEFDDTDTRLDGLSPDEGRYERTGREVANRIPREPADLREPTGLAPVLCLFYPDIEALRRRSRRLSADKTEHEASCT